MFECNQIYYLTKCNRATHSKTTFMMPLRYSISNIIRIPSIMKIWKLETSSSLMPYWKNSLKLKVQSFQKSDSSYLVLDSFTEDFLHHRKCGQSLHHLLIILFVCSFSFIYL